MWDIHRKIRYYREKARLSYEQVAASPGVKCSWQSVQQWEAKPTGNKKPTAPKRARLAAVAALFGTTEAELLSTAPPKDESVQADTAPDVARDAQEEMLLLLFRGLFHEQKRDQILQLRALFDANNYTSKQLGVKVLNGVNNADVRAAYGDVPPPKKQTTRKNTKRDTRKIEEDPDVE